MRGLARAAVALVAVAGAALTGQPALGHGGGSPAAVALDDDVTVCAATAKIVTDGLNQFISEMQRVTTSANRGDLTGAQQSVKAGGAALTRIADQLQVELTKVETPRLKDTIGKLAAEFRRLGSSLTDLTSLQTFDTTKLDQLAGTMRDICGIPVTPTAPPATPLPTVTQ